MIGYQYIQDLFTVVLSKSKAVQGRFFVSSRNGSELDSDTLGSIIEDVFARTSVKKYPLTFMMPPRSVSDYMNQSMHWDNYRIVLFFLKGTFYNSINQVQNINPNTRTSMHTILQDWHDMKRCAFSFIRALDIVQQKQIGTMFPFRMDASDKTITPVSLIGKDQASGVRLDFNISLFTGCQIEDYSDDDINSITVPTGDSHPEHNL